MEGAVAAVLPALLAVAARVRGEQHAARVQRRVQLAEHSRQLGARHMEQHGVGEDAVEAIGRQVEGEQVLLPDLAAAVRACHGRELRLAVEADRVVAEVGEGLQVAARATAEVEDRERRRAFDVAQQRRDVLADVVPARALPVVAGALAVVRERRRGNVFQRAQLSTLTLPSLTTFAHFAISVAMKARNFSREPPPSSAP